MSQALWKNRIKKGTYSPAAIRGKSGWTIYIIYKGEGV
ncbi:hypothetical protein CPAL_22330 [Clostridium thermopalmarium DSM 5974]|jgi:hypothetical protein|uniref:Uncharacterized protein n=2 Tax=Clostridium TaxID=1485 RepID=A0A151AKQ0_9CLOT|nr:hypothetical protein CLCOL_22440 [Clostridium colicanis DSM 13634]PRR70523.1 hypothetical protein CPAL_22330 [Clostridium thermopalmarium DSM 5974]